ncbi:hypothetical protein FP568_15710 [Pandoraea pnomenusa]|uniref:hypothetical protein n=1 Tax=Pandoraea pnomenusa TaxID=93220 RepID=UPI0011987BBB|nr:hypothetical protein [Pandoraea pnomenusa]QDX22557.1 hypothetical protein FP568_15710 [Pandoraea pnomenusa]
MTDHELLKLAAQALGQFFLERNAEGKYGYRMLEHVACPFIPWNPLENDSDAFRLAVSLELLEIVGASAWSDAEYKKNRIATVRRAIVRAAAEIGKRM